MLNVLDNILRETEGAGFLRCVATYRVFELYGYDLSEPGHFFTYQGARRIWIDQVSDPKFFTQEQIQMLK